MADIFISYARSDRPRAKALAEALEQEGYSVWWDPKIPPGKTFDEVIAEALGNAKSVVVLWSKESVKSEWVKEEASVAKRRKILVPALIDNVELPLGFGLIQAADLTDWEKGKPHSDFDSMIEAIAAIVGRPPAEEPGEDVKPKLSLPITEPFTKPPTPIPEVPEPEPAEPKPAAHEPRTPTSPKPPKRKHILLIAPLVLVVLILLVLVAVLLYVQRPKVPSRSTVTPSTREVPRSTPRVEVQPDKTITNSFGMKFVLIAAGTFTMGSPDEPSRDDDERQHKVTISEPFYLQTTEVTQGQWKAVMGNNPSEFKNCGDDCPVERVSWNDVQDFISQLNQMENTNKYRLPTEAEWEYACRAETLTPFNTGNCISTDQANYDGNYPLPGCSKGKDRGTTVNVASFQPNAWGLYDMHGNVWEWCEDRYGDYPTGHVTDPKGASSGKFRVLRGGSWLNFAGRIRSAYRSRHRPDDRNDGFGFRVARAL